MFNYIVMTWKKLLYNLSVVNTIHGSKNAAQMYDFLFENKTINTFFSNIKSVHLNKGRGLVTKTKYSCFKYKNMKKKKQKEL